MSLSQESHMVPNFTRKHSLTFLKCEKKMPCATMNPVSLN